MVVVMANRVDSGVVEAGSELPGGPLEVAEVVIRVVPEVIVAVGEFMVVVVADLIMPVWNNKTSPGFALPMER